jgi:DNA-binding response OmpR family regulator
VAIYVTQEIRGHVRHPIRILVVDDDAEGRGAVEVALRSAGYETACCGIGADAARLTRTFLPDMLILEMPQGGRVVGPDLARRLQTRRDQLVVFVTRSDRLDHRLAAFDAGADDYMDKP